MKSDEQKVREVEDKLDGVHHSCCIEDGLQHDEWSGRLFQGYFTQKIYKACNRHLRSFKERVYMEIQP
jgi:hypothetical protein